MGRMIYEGSVRLDTDDRTLSHLVVVISSKLRRGESFHFSWRNDASVGDGRTTIWVHPQASLVFEFDGSRRPSYNRSWLEALSVAANSPEGLRIVPEPADSDSGVNVP
ncbi:ATP-dependent DNA ligase [Microbacterium rhizosphaerae]|uniref:ATP-dependent DNA ligase n=1 Tax=Microbacterium rhizosphaerae TaxID=1678237 RepID=A0ABZ0SKQ0_9MICO|nr:ATP-dependent DNA ligase [Microbacterium rhizosphaerae]WPR89395.1 ATP-dependent DNA ligase [Microbacterium rhizosphaerae]